MSSTFHSSGINSTARIFGVTPGGSVATVSNVSELSPADPDLEPGFPVQAYVSGGTFHRGAAVNIVVGNIDADPLPEIIFSVPAHGPFMAWKGDASVVPGWPPVHGPVG